MNINKNNSVLVNKLIKLGVNDPDTAHIIINEYIRTGIIRIPTRCVNPTLIR